MSKLVPIGLTITLFFGMALDDPTQKYYIAVSGCIVGLMIASVGLAVSYCREIKRTHRSCNFYKFK